MANYRSSAHQGLSFHPCMSTILFSNKLNSDLRPTSPQTLSCIHVELVTRKVAEYFFIIDTLYILSSPAELWLLIHYNSNLCRLWLSRRASFVDTLSGISKIADT